jgi:hypothetical protein
MTEGGVEGFDDDICGFRETVLTSYGMCEYTDTINLAWIADNDGRQSPGDPCPYSSNALTSVTGVRILNTPSDTMEVNFNWWISNGNPSLDWGPRRTGTPEDPFRDFGGFLGTPMGDRNKYYIMSHSEADYDQLYAAVDHSAEGWLAPAVNAGDFADGYDTRYLISFGPFDIDPGQSLPVTFAYVAGENFHSDCEAFDNLFNDQMPEIYNAQLEFDDIGVNALWAGWMYDTPGVDTDSDGYRGEFHLCMEDTIWYRGDGVSDLRYPQVNPEDTSRLRLDTSDGRVRVKWNGLIPETSKNMYSLKVDFEGYNVYMATINEPGAYSLLAGYDMENYIKHVWNEGLAVWEITEYPFTLDSLQKLYGIDDPLLYTQSNPFIYSTDTVMYFTEAYYNNSDLSDTTKIHKLFQEEEPPCTIIIDSAKKWCPEDLTEDSLFFKYYEYEYVIDGRLPDTRYYIKVMSVHHNNDDTYQENNFFGIDSIDISVDVDDEAGNLIPSDFELRQNIPNPFNAATKISFALPYKAEVNMLIHNSLGQLVRDIDLGLKTAGNHTAIWDGKDNHGMTAASGIYIYTLRAGDFEASKKMVMVK